MPQTEDWKPMGKAYAPRLSNLSPVCVVLSSNSRYNLPAFRGRKAMALSDDLKALEELHSKGRLTDQEFTAAKAAAIANATGTATGAATATAPAMSPAPKAEKRKSSPLGRVIWALIGVALIWVYIQSRLTQPAATLFKEVVHMPVDLRTETFTIPARGWKAVGIQVPYNGSLVPNAELVTADSIYVPAAK